MPSATHRPADKGRAIFLLHFDQAITLRQTKRLCNSVASLRYPVEHARCPVRHRPRLRRAAGFGGAGGDPDLGARRDQPSGGRPRQDHPGLRPGWRRRGWSRWSGSSRTSSPARWTSHGRFARREFRCASAGCRAAGSLAMLPEPPPRLAKPGAWGSRSLQARRKGVSTRCCVTRIRAR